MPDIKTLYDEDFVTWSKQQAEALRSAARTGSNQLLDWENLAEEIESLGRSDRREMASRIATVIEHLVKLACSPGPEPRQGWRQTIRRERIEIELLLKDSPSLRRAIANIASSIAGGAIELALEEMDARGELTRSLRQTLRTKKYLDVFAYTPEQILGDWFPPEPKA